VNEKDRKYRQPGYQDYPDERPRKAERKPAPKKAGPRWQQTEAPRAPRMPGTRTVTRCVQCGTVLPALTEPLGQCGKCGFEMHSCKQCRHFDPGSRFECTQPIPERITEKAARNECSYFEIRVMVERDTAPDKARPQDARRAFDNLFRK
jgi:hypothetical protein